MSHVEKYFRKNPFKKKEDVINEDDIIAFTKRQIEESINLDYKNIKKYNDKEGLGKVISSFANTDGGLLILGISEKEEKDKNGKTIRILPNKPTWGDQHQYLKETLEDRLFSVIKPWIPDLKIYPVRHSKTSKVIFLIDTPKSTVKPHISNYRFYRRRNFSSEPIDYDHIKSMFFETHLYKKDLLEIWTYL